MKAIQMVETGRIQMGNVPTPEYLDGEVLIKVAYAGICGSDLHIFRGYNPSYRYPTVLGHEISGTIAAIGPGCPEHLQIGDPVAVNPLLVCGRCIPCLCGRQNLCRSFQLYGIDIDGGFAEFVKVRHDRVHILGPDTPLDVGALVEPYAVALHAISRATIRPGDTIVVLGGGPIGLMIALAAREASAGQIIVSEVSENRLQVAKQLGFIPVHALRDHLHQTVLDRTDNEGADIVFETAATPSTTGLMTKILRAQGTAVMVGVHQNMVQVDMRDVNLRELGLIGTMIYTENDFKNAVKLLPVSNLTHIISHRLPLEEGEYGYQIAMQGQASKVLFVGNS